jgi:hypothetical protein
LEEEDKMKNEILKKYHKKRIFKLISAVIIDLVGFASYLMPVLGESGDLVWGPISGVLIFILFPNRKRMAISGAIEELLPFTDLIPTAFLTWSLDYVKDKEKTLSEFVKNEVSEEQLVKEILNTHNIDSENLSE